MSRAVPQFTPSSLQQELLRLGTELSRHYHALDELERAPNRAAHAAEIAWHQGRIQSLEIDRSATETALIEAERQDQASLPTLRSKILETARIWGHITRQYAKAQAHPPGEPDQEQTARRVYLAFDELVGEAEAGREGLEPSGETGIAANGRGRPPEVYLHVPASSAPANGHAHPRTRRTGRAKRAT